MKKTVLTKQKFFVKLMALMLAFVLTIPMVAASKPDTVHAASSAALNTTWKTVIMGNTYTFWVKNATNVKSKSWSSSKPSIAKVNGKGKVTPVKAGKTTISCKIVFTDGTSKTVSATVAVKTRVPSTSVSVNADLGKINAHTIKEGETFQFKATIAPSTSTDYAYYTIADPDYASVTSDGLVTAKKAGVTMLEIRCGLNETAAKSASNTVTKRVYLYITPNDTTVTPTPTPSEAAKRPTVTSVSLASSKEIKIDFSNEILASSVIDNNGNLVLGTVSIGLTTGASPLGDLTPSLSKDKKSLLLATTGNFEGTYVITISESIVSTNNLPVVPYTEQKKFKDESGPMYVSTSIDETGYISTIHFSEAIDISSFSIYNVVGTTNTSLQAYLTNASNYTLSADKKSLSIDLGSRGVTTANVMVYMVGIKDIVGNASNPFSLPARIQIDATLKPNATLESVIRTSKNIVTATFSRPIQYAGYMYIGSDYVSGVVDSKDATKVNYTIPNPSITGSQVVTINGWVSYNAVSEQTTDVKRGVNFTLDATPPALVGYTLASSTENNAPVTKLTLTYHKEVALLSGNGTLSAKIISTNANVYNKKMPYTAVAQGKTVTLSFVNQATETGTYNFEIPAGLVMDQYENLSLAATINLSKQTDNSSVLPAPMSIMQDITNPSKLYIKFSQKLDLATVMNVGNYTVGNSSRPSSANIVAQDDTSATIELIFASGAIPTTATYPVTVRGIKGYNDSYAEMEVYQTIVPLVENAAPTFKSAKLTSEYSIVATFSESFTGSTAITVYNGNSVVGSSFIVLDNEVHISLDQPITSSAFIMFTKNELIDDNNNLATLTLNKRIGVSRAY